MTHTVYFILSIILSSLLYRVGGIGKPFNTKFRDFGCPIIMYSYLLTLWYPSNWVGWMMLGLAVFFTFLSLTTYYDKIFGYDNFYAHGFVIGLAALPLTFVGISGWQVIGRAIILGLFMGALNWWVEEHNIMMSDWVEELGRGAIITLTIPLLMF